MGYKVGRTGTHPKQEIIAVLLLASVSILLVLSVGLNSDSTESNAASEITIKSNTSAKAQSNITYYLILDYNFPWPPYNLSEPWRSSMAQAQALEVLVRAYELTHEIKYLNTAKKILNSFFVEVKDGGVTYKTPDDGWWFELYAGNSSKQPRVLNGMLFTLVGLYDYYNHTNDGKAKYLFDQGVISLKRNLPLYDNNGSSYYDMLKTPVKFEYHAAHRELLDKLHKITGDNLFKKFNERWANYKGVLIHQKPANITLDNSSIPIVNYGKVSDINIGSQRNPVTIDHIARHYYDYFIKYHDEYSRKAFLNNSDWIVDNARLVSTKIKSLR